MAEIPTTKADLAPADLGYSIWSKADMGRFIGELQATSDKAWPAPA